MSSIPNSAMPHAVAEPEAPEAEGKASLLLDGAQRLADKAREIPVSTLAIGAGVVAATAAATVALARRSGGKRGAAKTTTGTRKSKS